MTFIDTHTHLDGEEFRADIDEVIARARQAGASKLFIPGINEASIATMKPLVERYPGFIYQMIGLHPEEVNDDTLANLLAAKPLWGEADSEGVIAVGEVGLDYYWSREFEAQQLKAFERQIEWSIETRLPLMIHCRKAQNEMVKLLRHYERELPGGVFHCFTGNQHEALELLQFEQFVLGIGGVLTFKKSNLPTDLPASVPITRIVLETDSPYMAPVPHRGERNESSFIPHIIAKLAEAYGISEDDVCSITNATVERVFDLKACL